MPPSGPKFLKFDLGHLVRGDVVEVTLSNGANVELLDATNFNNFKRGQRHSYYGGLARTSPVRLGVPRSARWYVVVHMQGLRGSTRASVRVLNRKALEPLPPFPGGSSPLQEIAQNLADAAGAGIADREYDVFISHASEDKDLAARPLALALRERGLDVWFDELELRVGDSLRRKIDMGIRRSRFGVVILSPHFFEKGWPNYELDGLVTLSVSGKQVLLPIWHGVSAEEVASFSPSLSDRLALSTDRLSIGEIADEIAAVAMPNQAE